MSTIYILILFSTYGSPKHSSMYKFNGKEYCENAATQVRASTDRIIAIYVPKGPTK